MTEENYLAWNAAQALVDDLGKGATRKATERAAILHYDDPAGEAFWRQVAIHTVSLLREKGVLD